MEHKMNARCIGKKDRIFFFAFCYVKVRHVRILHYPRGLRVKVDQIELNWSIDGPRMARESVPHIALDDNELHFPMLNR